MHFIREPAAHLTDPASHPTLPARPAPPERRMADAVRAVAAAIAPPPPLPLGMADVAAALFARTLRFDAADPAWPDRDRFLLSAGGGALLLYALLHLTGHAGMEASALERYGQLDGAAAGQPHHNEHPAIEISAGPPGQGVAAAVGMALAERMMAARFGRSLVDHRTWVLADDADLVDGAAQEAASVAGHLRLEKLTVLWHDPGEGTPFEDTLRRYAAAGWATKRFDAHDPGAIAASISLAVRSRKPTLLACRTAPAAPPEAGEADPDVLAAWERAGNRGTAARRAWLKRLANHPMRAEFERVVAGRLPESWHEAAAALKAELADARPARPTGASSDAAAEALAAAIPELASAAAEPSLAQGAAMGPGSFAGRGIPFGPRPHAMAAALNGVALHGGVLPAASGSLATSDAMRPALRLAALMRQRVVLALTDDSIGLGVDGPAHQPVEHLAALRAVPGLFVLRPADPVETVECWELALRRNDGPSVIALSRQEVPALRADVAENRCARGGYVLAESDGARQATLIASGSEVAVAMGARELLAEAGIAAAVVSLPCWELFATLDEGAREQVLGQALRVGIEAACGFGWERWLGPGGIFVGVEGFGASAPAGELFRHFGITPEAVAAAVRKRLQPTTTEDSPSWP